MQVTKNPHKGGHKGFTARHSSKSSADPPDFEQADFEQAAHFLTLLDETAERWTFQTFDDNKSRKDPNLTRLLHGTLEEHWEELYYTPPRKEKVIATA